MKSNYPEILCLIPVYNEQENINGIINEFENLDFNIDFVIIDDGSDDNLYNVLDTSKANVIKHINNLGLCWAIKTGCRYAIEKKYSYVIRLDGDGQHDPKCIKQFIGSLIDGNADMIIGTRYYEGSNYKKQFLNNLGSKYFSLLIRIKTKCVITDPTSGFIGMKFDVINSFIKNSTQDYPEIETILIMNKLGYQVKEIPISMRRRKYGKSSITFLKRIYYVFNQTLIILFF